MPDEAGPVGVPVVFVGVEDLPILHANHFVIAVHQEDFIMTVGQFAPPILLGSEEEQREQASQLSYVPVKVVARLALTRTRVAELVSALQVQMQRYDDNRAT
jgi:hypothetical protein